MDLALFPEHGVLLEDYTTGRPIAEDTQLVRRAPEMARQPPTRLVRRS